MQFHPKDLSELDDLTEEHLGFSALSDGLGFSKGAKKANAPQPAARPPAGEPDDFDDDQESLRIKTFAGTGAVAAGPARPAPHFSAMNPARSGTSAKIPGLRVGDPAARPAAGASANVLSEPAAPRWERSLAFVLDALVIALPLSFAWSFSFGEHAREIFRADPRTPLVFFGIVFAAYFLLTESFGGQSIGKMIVGLRVVEDDKYQKPTGFKHACVRLLLFAAGTAFLGLGLLASFLDPKRRPLHDRYSGTIVRKRG
jgi:uncharacterized RDD family membrane protein YckC